MPTISPLPQDNPHKNSIAIVSVIVTVLVCIFLFYYESIRAEKAYEEAFQSIQKSLFDSTNKLTSDIDSYKKNIEFLSESPNIQHFLDAQSQSNNSEEQKIKRNISLTFQSLLKQYPNIRQARLILNNGNEYIRVEQNKLDITVTPTNLLQSKKDRDYFIQGMASPNNELFLPDISPNYEHGQIELPIWPAYRMVKPLRNAANDIEALLVFNIDATSSLNSLNTSFSSVAPPDHIEYFLINPKGFYVAAPDKSLLFGKELNNQDMNWFIHTNHNLDSSSMDRFETSIMGKAYLFSAKEVYFSNSNQNNRYILTAGIPLEYINGLIQTERKELLITVSGFATIIIIIVFFALWHIKNLESLYLNQSKLTAIISSSSDAILSIDHQGNIQSWNYASSILFGLSEEKAIGQPFFDLINETDQFSRADIGSILHSNMNERVEVSLKNQSNKKRILLLTLCPIQVKDGATKSIALIIRDITYETENKEKLEKANQNLDSEVKKRTTLFEKEKLKAIKANEAKSMFVANISHEIRTPLNGISGLLALARDKSNIDKQDNYLKMAQDSAQTLNILINDLLDLSKIESGKLTLAPKPTNLTLLLENIIASSFFLIKDKKLELILDTSQIQVNYLMLDENRVRQILTNLLSNAIKFTTEGEIILSAATHTTKNTPNTVLCEFQISDTGMGISQAQQAKLFKPFVQASSGISNQYGGTGLGLSISKQLCEIMDGDITLDSKIGEGSTFKASIYSSAIDESEIDPFTAITSSFNNKKIAIMVTNDQLRRILRKTLDRLEATLLFPNTQDELKALLVDSTLSVSFLDSEYFDTALDNAILSKGATAIYLCKNDELEGKVPNSRVLSRPVFPSSVIEILSKKTNQASVPEDVPAPKKTTSSIPSSQQVFVVDDNNINQIVAKGILSSLKYEIKTAFNGEEAIEKLKSLQPKGTLPIILMDCQMPILNGFEATRLIRQGKAGSWLIDAPIIAITADVMGQNIEDCKAAGMNDFLGKPFDPEVLKEIVMKWALKKDPTI